MNSLADLVKEKAAQTGIQVGPAKSMTSKEADWVKHKVFVSTMPVPLDCHAYVIKRLQTHPDTVQSWKKDDNGCVRITYPEYSQQYETQLCLYDKEGRLTMARFYAFNNDTYTCYIREVKF